MSNRRKENCEICDRWRLVNRYHLCSECWKAQDNTRADSQDKKHRRRREWVASMSLADLQKAKPEDTFGLYSGRTKQEKENDNE